MIRTHISQNGRVTWALLVIALVCLSRAEGLAKAHDDFSHFIGLKRFSSWKKSAGPEKNETVLTSPEFDIPIAWDQLVVSWNADAPPGTYLKFDTRAIYPGHITKYYTMARWSADPKRHPRESVKGQKDADGNVDTDTLILNKPGAKAQMRITLGSSARESKPQLKFLGLSFCDTKATAASLPAYRAAWGYETAVIERSQNSYPDEQGWCSPTSISMALTHWSKKLKRPELALDVPEVVPEVFDRGWGGTGNWPFNTAFCGSFAGMRAYVTRLGGMPELERWTAAGIPVVISSPWHLLEDGRSNTGSGHIVLVTGFTKEGDVVINDPGTNVAKRRVRHVYKRENVIKAWAKSHNTVYLIYPAAAKIPKDQHGHWEKK